MASRALYKERDLMPAINLDALIASAAGECFGIESERVARMLFPKAANVKALPSLLRQGR